MEQKGVLLLADRACDSEPLHCIVKERGNELYAPVRKSARSRPKGWNRCRCLEKHPKYNQRNIVESTFSVIKKRFGPLKAKLHFMKKREMAWRLMVHNIKRICKIMGSIIFRIKMLFRMQPKFGTNLILIKIIEIFK